VSDEFLTLAQTESQSRGMADLPLVRVPHPVGTIALDALRTVAESSIDAIIAKITRTNGVGGSDRAIESDSELPSTIAAPADADELFHWVADKGWSDGLPVLPPTLAAVERMVAACNQQPNDVIGVIPPLNGLATIEKLAANAVMAGCLPEYFPLVLAAVRGMLQPGFNLDGVQTTTGNVAPLAIVNGPCRERLEINCGANVLGQGWRANATIGRALRFALTNIGGATPGRFDKATLGQPAKFTFCIGENEQENPWQPLHVERGLDATANAVSMTGCSGVYSAVDMASQSARSLLKTFALTMSGGLASGVTSTEVLFVICPEQAIFARDGFTKEKIREELFGMARVPFEKISDENLELLAKRRPLWFKTGAPREIGAVDKPEDIWLVVAGGAGAKSAYLPGRTGTRLQTVGVE
jgi:hypothetical protein